MQLQVIVRFEVFVVHEPSRALVLVFVEQYGVVVFVHVGLQPFPLRPVVVIVLQNTGPDVPDGQEPLSGAGKHSGSTGQHGLMQYCDALVQLVEPHAIAVVPLDPPELVVDPDELVVVPEELTPELVVLPEELTPELVDVDVDVLDEGRPLEEAPLDPVCVLLLVWPSPSSPKSPSPPGPPEQATTRPKEKEATANETRRVRERESMVLPPNASAYRPCLTGASN